MLTGALEESGEISRLGAPLSFPCRITRAQTGDPALSTHCRYNLPEQRSMTDCEFPLNSLWLKLPEAKMLERDVAADNKTLDVRGVRKGQQLMRAAIGRPMRVLAAVAVAACLVVTTGGCVSSRARLEPVRIVDDAHSGGNALAVSADSRLGASSGWSGRIRLWRLPEGEALRVWRTSHGDLVGLMFLPGDEQLLSTGLDGVVRIWDLGGRLLKAYPVGSAVTSFYPGGDAHSVILGHADGRVTLWTVEGERLGLWELSDRRITAVAMNKSAALLAAGDYAGRVWRWRIDDQPELLQSPPSYARSLVFHPVDGGLLGSGWFDLFSWSADDIELQTISTAHRGIVNHLQFVDDGSYVASISRQTDSAVLLLDPYTGETLADFKKHALCGQRVVLSPDGRSMISNSDDASVRFYKLPARLRSGGTSEKTPNR